MKRAVPDMTKVAKTMKLVSGKIGKNGRVFCKPLSLKLEKMIEFVMTKKGFFRILIAVKTCHNCLRSSRVSWFALPSQCEWPVMKNSQTWSKSKISFFRWKNDQVWGSYLGKKIQNRENMFFNELNDSESKKNFFRKFFFGSFKILKKPRRAYFMNR